MNIQEKFAVAMLEVAETPDELKEVWNILGAFATADERGENWYRLRTKLLKIAMGDAKYFDVPTDPEQEYYVIESMFLGGEWRTYTQLDKLKKIVNEVL